jgi:hypothetical protein
MPELARAIVVTGLSSRKAAELPATRPPFVVGEP